MNRKEQFDVIVLGAGPGGYPAAIKAAQCGKKVALVEPKQLGGTCLNRGCIPSKALIANAEVLQMVREADKYGIITGEVRFDFGKMAQRRDETIALLRHSLEGLISANGITLFRGFGTFGSPREVKVRGEDSGALLQADAVIIATGSEPKNISTFPFDRRYIHDSTSLLEINELPRSLLIVGGGVIGCEFASLFHALGTAVTIVELMPNILPMESLSISQTLSSSFTSRGIAIKTGATVEKIDKSEAGVRLHILGGEQLTADMALIAIGRSLNTSGIGLEKAGVLVNADGSIPVDDHMETNVKGIYAVGDIASRWWLAHVATHQGIIAAQNAAGIPARMHYNAIPSVIFTTPEIASVGLTAEQAQSHGYQATVSAFPFRALGKAQAALQTEGFAQMVTDKHTGQILGAQVVGHEASILIAEMAVAIANELTVESIAETIHAHPTLAEVWLEAALIASEAPLHFAPRKKVPPC